MSDWDWDWLLKGSGLKPQDFMPAQPPSSLTPPPDEDSSTTQVPLLAYQPPTTLQDPNAANFDDKTRAQLAQDALNVELSKRGIAGKIYSDIHDALGEWADAAQRVQGQYGTEVNSAIYAMPGGGWQVGPAHSNGSFCGANGCNTTQPTYETLPGGGTRWGYIHTHPDNKALSASDLPDPSHSIVTNPLDNAAFAALPDGRIYGWNLGMAWLRDKQQNFQAPRYQYLVRPAQYLTPGS
jgi:hypothetical protein